MRIRGIVIGAVFAALLSALRLLSPSLFGAEWWLFDRESRQLARTRQPDPRIVLVTVSEQTIAALAAANYGRPPYSREVWARVVDELKRAGARVIAFDILFTEENPNDPEGDRAFARALENAPVILAAQTGERLTMPIFQAAGTGTMRLAQSEGGVVHWYSLRDQLPSLGAIAAEKFSGTTTRADRILVRWSGAKKRPEDLSYANVGAEKLVLASLMREEGQPVPAAFASQFRDKIVLVGYTAGGLMDLRANPLSPLAPGVELHANAIDNLINSDFNEPAHPIGMLGLTFLLSMLLGAAIDHTRSQLRSALGAILSIAGVLLLSYAALLSNVVVSGVSLVVAIALTWITITVLKFVEEQQQTAMLRTTFGRYVSPQILEHVLAHPEKVQLGGERRDLTILFSDIRGFTSISEASEPEQVVEMLNEYLTKMVDILLAHGGTLDKFIGDAVMGFWNAPAPDPEHTRHAVACAVEMIEETARLRERWEREGKPALRIGIGINTGDAVAGNIGAQRVFGYTVIGDAVNLASRLEGKNKDYGTEIIVSEFTLARMGDGFETVYLDEVKVKGKERAVKIYEVKGTR